MSAILLVWIGHKPALQFGELQRFLGIPKATLSRFLQNLVSRGLLTSRTCAADSRKKTFSFTPKGTALLEQLEKINNRLTRVGAHPLDETQIKVVTAAIERIASGLGAPLEPERPGEEPLFTQMRRLSRASGMIGPNYMGLGHDIMIYHIFSELGFCGHAVPLQFFLKNLRIPPSSLSREVSRLAQRGLIQREQARHDRKLTLLKLTEKGWRHFWACEETIGLRYEAALAAVSPGQIASWIEALQALEGIECPTFEDAPLVAELCDCEESLRLVRAFVVEEAVRSGEHQNLPNTILPPDHVCIAVREAGRLLAVALAPSGHRDPKLVFSSFLLSHEVSTEQLAKEVFAKASECLHGSHVRPREPGHSGAVSLEFSATPGLADPLSPSTPPGCPNPLYPLPPET